MAYIELSEYQANGGTLDEEGFTRELRGAEALFNHWTLNRLKSPQVVADLKSAGDWDAVLYALTALIDRMQGIREGSKAVASGSVVTSFSNGVNSFSFGGGASANGSAAVSDAEKEAYAHVARLLPVELISACVAYNEAR